MITDVSPVQLLKAELAMAVTFSVIVTFSMDGLPLNSDVTVSQSKVTSLMPEQLANALDATDFGFPCMVTVVSPLQP